MLNIEASIYVTCTLGNFVEPCHCHSFLPNRWIKITSVNAAHVIATWIPKTSPAPCFSGHGMSIPVAVKPPIMRPTTIYAFSSPAASGQESRRYAFTTNETIAKNPKRKQIFNDYTEARQYSNDEKWFQIFTAKQSLRDTINKVTVLFYFLMLKVESGAIYLNSGSIFRTSRDILILRDLEQPFASPH